jgi:hypothetical protein
VATIAQYAYLWDGSDQGWVLVRSRRSPLPTIFNAVSRTALTIEDDVVCLAVVEQMRRSGVEVLPDLPV